MLRNNKDFKEPMKNHQNAKFLTKINETLEAIHELQVIQKTTNQEFTIWLDALKIKSIESNPMEITWKWK